MDPISLNWVIERINWLINRFSTRDDQRMQERRTAIQALLKALGETRIYFGTQRGKKETDRAKEEVISRLWIDASDKVRQFDDDLADRCYNKGTYWADPTGWNDDALLAADMSIARVEAGLKKLQNI